MFLKDAATDCSIFPLYQGFLSFVVPFFLGNVTDYILPDLFYQISIAFSDFFELSVSPTGPHNVQIVQVIVLLAELSLFALIFTVMFLTV